MFILFVLSNIAFSPASWGQLCLIFCSGRALGLKPRRSQLDARSPHRAVSVAATERQSGRFFGSAANAMASASAAEETSWDLSAPESLLGFLEDSGIRLVRLEYLIELSASGRPLPRRQEAEKETTSLGLPALVESSELKEVRIDPNTAHMVCDAPATSAQTSPSPPRLH